MNEVIANRLQKELGVFLVEECGFRHWIWFPHMSLSELVNWWRNHDSVSEFAVGLDSLYRLPGNIYEAEAEEEYEDWMRGFRNPRFSKAWINSENDTYLYTNENEFVVDKAFPAESIERETARLVAFFAKE